MNMIGKAIVVGRFALCGISFCDAWLHPHFSRLWSSRVSVTSIDGQFPWVAFRSLQMVSFICCVAFPMFIIDSCLMLSCFIHPAKLSTETLEGNRAAFFSRQGRGHTVNEDRVTVISPFFTKEAIDQDFLIGVFDGHGRGGEAISEFARQAFAPMLASALEQQPQPWDYDKVLDAFTTTCRRIDDECPPPHSAGTTLSGALRLGDMLYVANVGDSATFVANYTAEEGVRIMFETTPHKPDDLVERFRIEQLGGIIKLPDPGPRQSAIIVLGGEMGHLAMSRSLGDRNASSVGVIPDPDVAAFDLSKFQGTKLFVVSVTDGLFDVMSMQDIANEIARRLYVCEGSSSNNSLKEGCEYLVDRAYDTWQQLYSTYAAGDDMTIAVHEL